MSEQELATRGQRLSAVIIDGIIGGIVSTVIMMVILPIVGVDSVSTETGIVFSLVLMAMNIGTLVLINGKLLASNGQTVGKKLMGIKIVTLSGGILPLQDVLLRRYLPPVLVSIIPIIGALACLADILCIFRGDQRCIHDLIAGTRVVKA